jgi:glycosyltransferase involved in cell wall biosynthesis
MNILTLCLSPDLGGLELYAYRSAMELNEKSDLVFIAHPHGKLEQKLAESPIKTHYLSSAFYRLPIISAFRLSRLIDNHNIDLVHMHWGKDLALAALAKKLAHRKPALVYTRQMDVTRSKKDLYHQFLYKEVDRLITITHLLADKYSGFLGDTFSNRITPLYYGVNPPSRILTKEHISKKRGELGLSDNDFIAGCFGRLEQGKGQYLLIEAIKQAADAGKTIKALIVGHEMNYGYRNELKQLATELGVSENIVFHDFVPDPQSLMQICDCMVLTTHEETFGLVLPEAMRAGIAVIGSNAGGVPEIIDHDETGLLFESKNSTDLNQQLLKLRSDADLTHRLAMNGKKKSDKLFNNELHFEKLFSIMVNLSATDEH